MPSFTPEQKAFIREIVHEVFEVVIERHVQACPWGKKMMRGLWFALGIGVGSGLLGFGTAKLFF